MLIPVFNVVSNVDFKLSVESIFLLSFAGILPKITTSEILLE